MGFVRAWSTATGDEQLVPEHFFDNPILSRGLTRHDPNPPADDDESLEDLTIAQLRDYAAAHDVDLTGATRKADIITAITDTPATGDQED